MNEAEFKVRAKDLAHRAVRLAEALARSRSGDLVKSARGNPLPNEANEILALPVASRRTSARRG
jgi:hypothetical protein